MSGAEVQIEIEYKLTEDERTEMARHSVRLSDKHDKLVDDFKENRATWRGEIKTAKQELTDAQKAFMVGSEPRKLKCVEDIDLDNKQANYIHLGKIVKSRDLTVEEIAVHGTKPMFEEPSPQEDIGHVIQSETKRTKKDLLV